MRTESVLKTVLLLAAASCATPAARAWQLVTSPSDHLGRPLADDFELADWNEVSSYFDRLGAESPHVNIERVGTTTEGRDFLLAVLSSEDNLANLEQIQAHARTLADPRGATLEGKRRAMEEGKLVLFISCAMHATETAAPQMAMELAYRLATSEEEPWRRAREEMVVLLAPSLNPDGQDHVVSWYRETVGTPFEASGLLKLYQYYAGHDNNRDWFMLTQAETRVVTDLLYSTWFPQVYWDVHQQGSSRERMFVPPFRDPLNPNLDAGVIAGIDALGSRALFDLTRAGLRGVSTGVSYDMWWNGGNRNVPVRHNIVGLLTEAASVRIASPVFLPRSELSAPRGLGQYAPSNRFPDPWPGGWWRLRDIVDYELAFAESLFGSLSRERRLWLRNGLEASERAIAEGTREAPRAWLIPSDNRDVGAVRRLVQVLLWSGVEIHVASDTLDADGRSWPAGTIVIQRAQPYGSHVKDLFEVQRYPEGEPPYDVAGWTLPFLLGVQRVEVNQPIEATLERILDAGQAVAAFEGDARAVDGTLSSWDSDDWKQLVSELASGARLRFAESGAAAGLFIPEPEGSKDEPATEGPVLDSLPRIGIYSPWSGSMDEGWLRWVFDTWGAPYVTVRNEMLRAGSLDAFLDVLVVPSVSPRQLDRGRSEGSVPSEFTGGLDPEGAIAVEEFVRDGGRLITLGRSSTWAIDLFRLPLVDVTRDDEAGEFSCPGSVLRTIPETERLTVGLPASVPVFFSRSPAWREMTDDERQAERIGQPADGQTRVLLRYAPTRVLLSGWIQDPEVINGRAAWIRARHGAGEIDLFAFRPQYRGWSQASFSLLYRALLLDSE